MKLTFDNYEYNIKSFNYRIEVPDSGTSIKCLKTLDCEFPTAVDIDELGDLIIEHFDGSLSIVVDNNTTLNFTDFEFSTANIFTLDESDQLNYSIIFQKEIPNV